MEKICQIHQLALCCSRKHYWYSTMGDLNSLPLITEKSDSGSNFPFKILIFELRSLSPLKFPKVRGWVWIFLEAHIWGGCGFILVWQPKSHNCHMTWLPPERLWRRLHDNIILSFSHFITDLFLPSYFITTEDCYSVGSILLTLEYALSGPLHSKVFTMHHK